MSDCQSVLSGDRPASLVVDRGSRSGRDTPLIVNEG